MYGCDQHFTGSRCETDMRACSSTPCLNNRTCSNDLSDYSFTCNCGQFYTGKFCEHKINLCQNETCSSNGVCYDENFKAKCMCFPMITGLKCETKSEEMKTIETVVSVASIIAIIVIVSFYAIIMAMDLPRLIGIFRKQTKYKPKKEPKAMKEKKKLKRKAVKLDQQRETPEYVEI
jgi:hypothetical protein